MKSGLKLFRLFGIPIQLHYSWWIVFVLLSWSLATSFFPEISPGYDSTTYWIMGIVSALFLFISVLLHELSHSLVALSQKIKVESITLFFFGGVAGIPDEEMKPKSEFLMAIAGPLFSFVLGGLFYLIHSFQINAIFTAITFYLYRLNFIVGIFNLIPGYPLDGGRAFRALLYGYYNDIIKATKIATLGGRIFAGFLFAVGLMGLFSGLGNGLWFILLGGFLYVIAGLSLDQVVIRETLRGVSLQKLIVRQITEVSAEMKFRDFVKKYASSTTDLFVVKGKSFQGFFAVELLPYLPRRDDIKLQEIAIPLSAMGTVSMRDDASRAFQKVQAQQVDFVPVVEQGRIIGIVTRRALVASLLWRANNPSHHRAIKRLRK